MSRVTPQAFDERAADVGKDTSLAIRNLNKIPFLFGRAIVGVALPASGTVDVEHGLGRMPSGYFVTKSYGAGNSFGWQSADETAITFASTAIAIVDLWVW